MAKNMVTVLSAGVMDPNTRGTSWKTTSKGTEFINGKMEEFIKVIGRKIKCTGRVSLHGATAKNMKDHT